MDFVAATAEFKNCHHGVRGLSCAAEYAKDLSCGDLLQQWLALGCLDFRQ